MPTTRQTSKAIAMEAATPLLRIGLLATFTVTVAERVIPDDAWGTRKAQHLVKLLALAPGLRLTRDQLLEALWPEQDPDAVMGAFHQTLYRARRALGHPGFLQLRGGSLTLAAADSCVIDSHVFAAAAAAARRTPTPAALAAALESYTGPLLPDDRYEDWAIAPAEQLRHLALALRRDLAALHEATGDWPAAGAQWQRLLADEPADEAAHAGLMRCFAATGQRQRAIQQYHALHAALRDDLAISPDPATQRLYAAILSGHFPTPAADHAPVVPPNLPPHQLPIALTSLIGRAQEIAAVTAALRGEARLVTLTGIGGSGKSRLALAAAEALMPEYPDGVWWIGLAPLADGALVAESAAQALAVRPRAGQEMTTALTAALRERTLLLILDNAEHLRDACATLAIALLTSCPGVRILVTSRAALHVAGEQIWGVPPLQVPAVPSGAVVPAQVATLAENDAVHLFVARAQLVRAGFALTPGNVAGVVSICRRVEGLPLALELAAARVGLLEPGQLAARLDNALRLLTGGPQGVPDRQRTLRATLDWSYHLLDEATQQLLARLAVFAGGWTLDAAEEICASANLHVLAGLAELVEQSLVQVEPGTGGDDEPRYRLLEPVRQYVAELLGHLGESDHYRDRHAAYFLALAERTEPEFYRARQHYWIALLARDEDNIRAALRWFADTDSVGFVRLVVAFMRFWYTRSSYNEGLSWTMLALRATDLATAQHEIAALHPAVLFAAAQLSWPIGAFAAAEVYYQQALDLAIARSLPAMIARTEMGLGIVASMQGHYAPARPHFEASLALARQLGDQWLLGVLLNNLGLITMWQGDVEQARRYQGENLALCRATNDAHGVASALVNLCEIAFAQGDLAAIVIYADEALARFRSLGDLRGTAVAHNNLAVAAQSVSDFALAEDQATAALALYGEIDNAAGMALSRRILAEVATARGDRATTRALYRQCFAHYQQTHHARDVAQGLESLTALAQRERAWSVAAQLVASATTIRQAENLRLLPADRALHQLVNTAARDALGETAFDAASAAGGRWSVAEAIAQALAYLEAD